MARTSEKRRRMSKCAGVRVCAQPHATTRALGRSGTRAPADAPMRLPHIDTSLPALVSRLTLVSPMTTTGPDTSAPPAPVAAAIRARASDCAERVFLRADDASWTFTAAYREACRYANLLLARRGDGPFHVGVLMDNRPAFVFAELG